MLLNVGHLTVLHNHQANRISPVLPEQNGLLPRVNSLTKVGKPDAFS